MTDQRRGVATRLPRPAPVVDFRWELNNLAHTLDGGAKLNAEGLSDAYQTANEIRAQMLDGGSKIEAGLIKQLDEVMDDLDSLRQGVGHRLENDIKSLREIASQFPPYGTSLQ